MFPRLTAGRVRSYGDAIVEDVLKTTREREDLAVTKADASTADARRKRATPASGSTTLSRWISRARAARRRRGRSLRAVCHPSRRRFQNHLCRRCSMSSRAAPWPARFPSASSAARSGAAPPLPSPRSAARPRPSRPLPEVGRRAHLHVDGSSARCWLCGVDAYRTGRAMSMQAACALAAAQSKRGRWTRRSVSARP